MVLDAAKNVVAEVFDVVSHGGPTASVIVSGILDINLTSYQRCSGDHTLDGSVDILDIVSIITIILET